MRTSNFSRNHPYAKARGWVSPNRAANSLPNVSDGSGNEVINASEILVIGGTVSEPEDGIAQISFGGLSGSSNSAGVFPGSAGTPVYMKNNAAFDLIPGDVVVTDPTDDSSVTTTATASNTRIAGVVQAPIAVNTYGPVLFNGLTTIINTTGTITRGSYAMTSASARLASATATRGAGNFGVYLTGADLPDFAAASANTEAEVPVTELAITMPGTIPANRILFLALWLGSAVSSVSVAGGWTLIGAETGFYYYVKASVGDDTAVATWTTASVAVATVLVLHESVSLANPIESHDYDTSTSAAAVAGLDDVPRYAIAGVKSNVTSPGSGFVRLGGGTAGFDPGGSLAIVQEASGTLGSVTFASPVTPGNLLVSILASQTSDGVVMAEDGSGGNPDESWTDVELNANTDTPSPNAQLTMQAKIATVASAGPYYNSETGAGATNHLAYMFEVSGVGVDGFESFQISAATTSPIDLGTFASVGANDLVILAAIARDHTGGFPDPDPSASGYTEDYFDRIAFGGAYFWVAHRSGSGGSVDAEFSHVVNPANFRWGAVAAHFVSQSQSVAGTLAGKYIAHDSSVTSPFSGGADATDAIFAVNLMADAKPSALLYGPDLGAGGGGSEPTADAHIADTSDAHDASAVSLADSAGLFTATDVEAAIAELATKGIGYTAHGNMGSTETFSALTGWHSGTLNANCTYTFSGATSGIVASMVHEIVGDGTSTETFPGSVVWPGGAAPGVLGAAEVGIRLFQSRDGGTTWYGFQAGAGTASPLTTKGDLWGYDTDDARVPVGSNGYLLVADSTDAQGVVWENPETTGHWEVLMDGASPPEPLENGSGTDWLYVWVP